MANAARGEATRAGAACGEATRGDQARGDKARSEKARGGAARGEATRGDQDRGEAACGGAVGGEAPPGDQTRADQTRAEEAEGVAGPRARELAEEIIERLAADGGTVAAAESLTGGLVAAALTDVPGSSAAFRGGVVAYATELKGRLLGVPSDMLAAHGPVYGPVAAAMAEGVRRRLGATVGVATTGVAGPGDSDGFPAGTVHVAVSLDDDTVVRTMALPGDRDEVRRLAVERALGLLLGRLREG